MSEPFEVRRRATPAGLAALLALVAGALVAWRAWEGTPWAWALAGVLVVAGLALGWAWRGASVLLVADDQGIRLLRGTEWIGLPWSEVGEVVVEQDTGPWHGELLKVVTTDGRHVYRCPVGRGTDVSSDAARYALARRRPAAAY